jgi:AraC-like DNA-binding protein
MSENLRFSTDTIAPRDRFEAWSAAVWSRMGGMEAEAVERQVFSGTAHIGRLGDVLVGGRKVSHHRAARTPRLIRQSDMGLISLMFQFGGEVCIEQSDRQLVLNANQWCLYDGSRPYSMLIRSPADQVAVHVPRKALMKGGVDTSQLLLRAFSIETGIGHVLSQSVQSTVASLDTLERHSESALGEFLVELARLAVAENTGEIHLRSSRDIMVQRIKAYVRNNIADENLSIDKIASALRCTKRYLHKVFQHEDVHLNRYIWSLRLEHCGQDLANPRMLTRSITDIAFSWGFSNSAHFSRAFKDHFGMPPRAYREMHAVPPPGRRC